MLGVHGVGERHRLVGAQGVRPPPVGCDMRGLGRLVRAERQVLRFAPANAQAVHQGDDAADRTGHAEPGLDQQAHCAGRPRRVGAQKRRKLRLPVPREMAFARRIVLEAQRGRALGDIGPTPLPHRLVIE